MLKAANPQCQAKWLVNPDRAFLAQSPTLRSLNRIYGEGMATTWLMAQLTDLNEYCNCRDKLSVEQTESLADLIANGHLDLTMSEMLLFFGWMKAGEYGEFYGALDPIRIAAAFQKFLKERTRRLGDLETVIDQRSKTPTDNKPTYTRQEWEELKAKIYDTQGTTTSDGHPAC